MKFTVTLFLLLIPSVSFAKDFDRNAKSGERKGMHTYRSWKAKDCTGNTGVVKVASKPLNGTVSSEQIESEIGFSRRNPGVATNCTGKPIPSFRVFYRSNPGFRGTDKFQIEVTFGKRKPELDNYTVEVR